MKKACIYARFSSDNQRNESIDAQIRAIRDYCSSHDLVVTKTYIDQALSGTSTDDRVQFLQMIDDSKNGLFDYVLVHKLDRFARNRYDQAIFERKLNDNNVKIISVLEQFNDSPESVILKSVLSGMNEYYSLNLSREVKKGMYENFHNGQHAGGTPPLGLDVDKETKLYIINEEEAEIVRLIFQLVQEGNGYSAIARILNEKGLLNKRKKPFTMSGIRDMIPNEKYIGTYILGKKDKNGKLTGKEKKQEDIIPAIIDKNTFYNAQNALKIKSSGRRPNSKVDYLLTGICTCGECGGTYSGGGKISGRNTKYYMYNCTYRKSKKTTCKNPTIRQTVLENLVFKAIKEEIFNPERLDIFIQELTTKLTEQNKNLADNTKKNDKAIQNIKDKKEKLLGLFLEGFINKEEFINKNDVLELEAIEKIKEKEIINNSTLIDIDKIRNYVQKLSEGFENKNITIKKQILQTFVEEIVIYKDRITIRLKFFGLADRGYDGGSDGNRTRVQSKSKLLPSTSLVYLPFLTL